MMVMVSGILMPIKQVRLVASKVQAAIEVPYSQQHIALGSKRSGRHRSIQYIVIHNTANSQSTAQNEVDYLSNVNNTSSTAFHMAVDDEEIIEVISPTEIAYHAGDGNGDGNHYGIGIEICESGDFTKATVNAAKLVAYLMKTYDIPLNHVKTHHDFSGKNCPRLMLEDWDSFLEEVKDAYEALDENR